MTALMWKKQQCLPHFIRNIQTLKPLIRSHTRFQKELYKLRAYCLQFVALKNTRMGIIQELRLLTKRINVNTQIEHMLSSQTDLFEN